MFWFDSKGTVPGGTFNSLENKAAEKPIWTHTKVLLRITFWGVELERKRVDWEEGIVILHHKPELLKKYLMQ